DQFLGLAPGARQRVVAAIEADERFVIGHGVGAVGAARREIDGGDAIGAGLVLILEDDALFLLFLLRRHDPPALRNLLWNLERLLSEGALYLLARQTRFALEALVAFGAGDNRRSFHPLFPPKIE